MTTLDELFHGERRTRAAEPSAVDAQASAQLARQLGGPRTGASERASLSTPEELAAMVRASSQRAAANPVSVPTGGRGEKRRERGRFDAIGLASAGLALAAVLVAGTVGVVQAATVDPTSAAVSALRQDEAMIQNASASLEAARKAASDRIAGEIADATALRAALDTLRSTPDPREGEDTDVVLNIIDRPTVDDFVAVLDSYAKTMSELPLPSTPDAYEPAKIKRGSLADVADAVDAAQAELSLVEESSESLKAFQADVDARRLAHGSAVEAFAARFVEAADVVVKENPDVEQLLRDEVMKTAQAVVASKLQGAAGAATILPFRDAVINVISGQRAAEEKARRVAEEQARREAEEEAARQQQQQQPPAEPTDPGTEEPIPEPTTEPTDPGTTEPGNGGGFPFG